MRAREGIARARRPQLHPQLEAIHLCPARVAQPVLEPTQRLRVVEPPVTRILGGAFLVVGLDELIDDVSDALSRRDDSASDDRSE